MLWSVSYLSNWNLHIFSNKQLEVDKESLETKVEELQNEVEKQKGEVEFFKKSLITQPTEIKPVTPRSLQSDLDRIKELEGEVSKLGLKNVEYESKLQQMESHEQFLQKLLQDKEEVRDLKIRYTHMSGLLQNIKNPKTVDNDLMMYAENLEDRGKTMFTKDEDFTLIPEDDLDVLEKQMSSRHDTFKMSRSNTNVDTDIHRRKSEDFEFNFQKSKSNMETTELRKRPSQITPNLDKQVAELKEQNKILSMQNSDLQEQIDFRNRYISQLEEGGRLNQIIL